MKRPRIWPRRDFLRTGARASGLAAATLTAPNALWALGQPRVSAARSLAPGWLDDIAPARDLKALAMRAVDAATAAGATYADVRLTYLRDRVIDINVMDTDRLGIGVRALVDGYWGFVSHPYWTSDAAAWAGREAVAQAKLNAGSRPRVVELCHAPVVNGDWQTPLKIDPFTVAIEEMLDWLSGHEDFMIKAMPPVQLSHGFGLWTTKVREAFASSEGSFCTQTRSRIDVWPWFYFGVYERPAFLGGAAAGWEFAYEQGPAFRAWVPEAVEHTKRMNALPVKPVEVGQYTVVFDARSMAYLLAESLGAASQLDRTLGYEANASGTSYLGPDPLEFLSTAAASPIVTIMGDRSRELGLSTVRWDAEGVEPNDFPLVKAGTLVDYQTTRESASWIKDYYGRQHVEARSRGCAGAADALSVTTQHTPNLTLVPGPDSTGLDELIAGVEKGVLLCDTTFDMDFQHRSGVGRGTCYEIRGGRVVARIDGAAPLFQSLEIWKNVIALSGPKSAERWAMLSEKGEPSQRAAYTVWAVPAVVKDCSLIDIRRKGS